MLGRGVARPAAELPRKSTAIPPIASGQDSDNRQQRKKVQRRRKEEQERVMVKGLDEMMRVQVEALRLRSYRQEILAANLANADTPNFKAVDFDFGSALRDAAQSRVGAGALGNTGGGPAAGPQLLYRNPSHAALDGNSVEADAERAKIADNAVRYEAALRVLTGQIKTMLSAIQG
jgi:flagellar basal-body rod protein FlgB